MAQQTCSVDTVIANQTISFSSGKMAKQANGSVLVQSGDMVLLATVCLSKEAKEGIDFLPLTIEIAEKMYAAGKIPGGFFKREARPSTDSTLLARLIDRPLRPCFPKGFHKDVQIIITVLSFDETIAIEPLALNAASAALSISDAPFNGPVGGVLVGHIDGEFVMNPSPDQLDSSDLNIVVAGNKEAVLMVEAGANEVSEELVIEAILKGHETIKDMITLQEKLVAECGKTNQEVPGKPEGYDDYKTQINSFLADKIETNLVDKDKKTIETFLSDLEESVRAEFINEDQDNIHLVLSVYNELKKDKIRNLIISKKIRVDGRRPDEVRDLSMEVSLLPSTHGSALFTRGETQSLGVVTLGTSMDEQTIDGLADSEKSKYFFHYNFPPFSVGETGFLRTGRRELGHGSLAERALQPVLPSNESFPYTIRVVSEIFESNGSSSMASVCSGSMALMDCGVPTSGTVSGIAMGLLMNEDGYIILSDIQGLEDHYGDMDFKVAGTQKGITALQLDIKIAGLSKEILVEALEQAKEGRLHILHEMNKTIHTSRDTLSPRAPKIHSFNIDPEKVGLVIGPGGKMIRKIEEDSGATVTIPEGNEGEVCIFATDQKSLDIALNFINSLVKEPEIGEVYEGRVVKTVTFGAFIEICPGKEGLLHISKMAKHRVEKVEDEMKEGDFIKVKIANIDNQKKISLERILS